MHWMFLLLSVSAVLNLYCAWNNVQVARINLENAERNERLARRLAGTTPLQAEHVTAAAIHPLLRKWWMRQRPRVVQIVGHGPLSTGTELYCPLWAKPLDWLHAALFGSSKLQAI